MAEQVPDILFWLFCILTISGAVYVLFSKHVLYAAYGMLVTFLGVAGIFIFALADFVSAAQIMIYVGGILVLMVFGIMLSSSRKLNPLEIENAPQTFSLLLVIAMAACLIALISKMVFRGEARVDFVSVQTIGFDLMTSHVLALEIIGILLLMALIGAAYIAKNDE